MGETTKIEWCDATLNLWWGCTKVSDGCKNCYAETLTSRYGHENWGPRGVRRPVKSWRSTLDKVSRRAETEGRRLRVFVQSMADTFEGPETMGGIGSENWKTVERLRHELINAVYDYFYIDFLLLTKRPENVMQAFSGWRLKFPENLWIGTSTEDQKTADERIPYLLQTPAKVKFLSCEPLLGPVDLTMLDGECSGCTDPRSEGTHQCGTRQHPAFPPLIRWVICGGESGPNARPMHPDWARSLRDQCLAADVSFFFKQWGAFVTEDQSPKDSVMPSQGHLPFAKNPTTVYRLGKKLAGRLLDGREWSEFPEVLR